MGWLSEFFETNANRIGDTACGLLAELQHKKSSLMQQRLQLEGKNQSLHDEIDKICTSFLNAEEEIQEIFNSRRYQCFIQKINETHSECELKEVLNSASDFTVLIASVARCGIEKELKVLRHLCEESGYGISLQFADGARSLGLDMAQEWMSLSHPGALLCVQECQKRHGVFGSTLMGACRMICGISPMMKLKEVARKDFDELLKSRIEEVKKSTCAMAVCYAHREVERLSRERQDAIEREIRKIDKRIEEISNGAPSVLSGRAHKLFERKDGECILEKRGHACHGSKNESVVSGSLSKNASDLMIANSQIGIGIVAPASAHAGEDVWIQVCGNVKEYLREMIDDAIARDRTNNAGERRQFDIRVVKGSKISFTLAIRGVVVEDECQEIRWDEEPFQLDFFAHVPTDATLGAHVAGISVSVDGLPAGKFGFVLNVIATDTPCEENAEISARSYKHYFISYSSKDVDSVVDCLQGMKLADADILQHSFFDKMFLRPGERYEPVIYDYIDNKADVFLLFWSKNAASSDWVKKEYKRALKRREHDDLPEIRPIPLETPIPDPPAELADREFWDMLVSLKSRNGRTGQ